MTYQSYARKFYLMQAFVAGGFRNAELNSLNFVRKSIQAVTLAGIATAHCRYWTKGCNWVTSLKSSQSA